MGHELYASVDSLLAPETLTELTGQTVRDVALSPFQQVDGLSGSELLWVDTNGRHGRRYVLKCIATERDWVMRGTEDWRCRETVTWQVGLLDRLPPEVAHPVIACAVDGQGWAVLMRDVGHAMVTPGDDPISTDANERFLDAMAAMHATFWDEPEAADPTQGFCSLWHHYSVLSVSTSRREAGESPIPRLVLEGWDLLERMVEPAVAGVLRELVEDPRPLVDALSRYPQTVLHGDWKLGNVGLLSGEPPRTLLLDWSLVGPGPGCVDLAWYLAVNSARLPVSKEATIALYRRRLERHLGPRFDEHWWRPQLELSLLGGFVRLGWNKLLGAANGGSETVRARERAEVVWWAEQARTGALWL